MPGKPKHTTEADAAVGHLKAVSAGNDHQLRITALHIAAARLGTHPTGTSGTEAELVITALIKAAARVEEFIRHGQQPPVAVAVVGAALAPAVPRKAAKPKPAGAYA